MKLKLTAPLALALLATLTTNCASTSKKAKVDTTEVVEYDEIEVLEETPSNGTAWSFYLKWAALLLAADYAQAYILEKKETFTKQAVHALLAALNSKNIKGATSPSSMDGASATLSKTNAALVNLIHEKDAEILDLQQSNLVLLDLVKMLYSDLKNPSDTFCSDALEHFKRFGKASYALLKKYGAQAYTLFENKCQALEDGYTAYETNRQHWE